MTHEELPRVCTPAEFMAASPEERRELVYRQITEHPETHLQSVWIDTGYAYRDPERYGSYEAELDKPWDERSVCGTAFCFAGWATVLAGDAFLNRREVRYNLGGLPRAAQCRDRARELLGLAYWQAHDLFSQWRSRNQIRRLLDEFKGSREE